MAILIEGVSVVITTSDLDTHFPGGSAAFAAQVPNSTYCSDGVLARVSFMVVDDARLFVGALANRFNNTWKATPQNIAVIDATQGFLTKCDWLKADLKTIPNAEGKLIAVTVAWLGDGDPSTFSAPAGWQLRSMVTLSQADLEQNYEVVKVEETSSGGAVTTYRHRETGKTWYVGRPSIAGHVPHDRYVALRQSLQAVLSAPASKDRSKSAAELYDRATSLVDDTNGADPGALHIQGLAARAAGRWLAAEQAFRKVTELRPDELDAWLELTWALASLDQTEEAIAAARQAVAINPESAAALGNLASALSQGGRPREALPSIDRALELDPADSINRRIRERILASVEKDSTVNKEVTGPAPPTPWYKRWLG
jgi:tetratricopeptide (TPR) repeat protein